PRPTRALPPRRSASRPPPEPLQRSEAPPPGACAVGHTLSGGAADQLEADVDHRGAGRAAVQPALDQQASGFAADGPARYAHGGEAKAARSGEVEVAEPGDGEPVRYLEAAPAGFAQRAEGDRVARAEHGVGVRVRIEQPGDASGARLDRLQGHGWRHPGRPEPRLAQRLPIPFGAPAPAVVVRAAVADEGDAPVAELGQE